MTESFQLFESLPAHIEDALRSSIQRFGVLVPVVTDQHGTIIDGHHRRRIADQLGVTYRVDVVNVADGDEAKEIARTLNADRRQLSEEQRMDIAARLRSEGKSLNQIAEALAHAEGNYEKPLYPTQVSRLLEKATTLTDVKVPERVSGKDGKSRPATRRPTIVAAKDEHEAERAQQALSTLGDQAPQATMTTTEAARLAARQRTPEPAVTPPAPSTDGGRYRCVVIDPPWPVEKIERDERPNQGATLDYPTLPIYCRNPTRWPAEDIERLACWFGITDDEDREPCQSIECIVGHQLNTAADPDGCHIYLWTTHKFLPDALELFDSWDVAYQCVMTWRKNVGITPFSWMYDTEHALFGRLGHLKLERLGLRLSFDAPVHGHSVKPDVFYERALAASPGPRLEMFARTARDGFIPWGNEVAASV